MKKLFGKKVSFLQMFLTLLFVVALLVSNVVTSKQIQLPFGIVMTGGLFVFPITYILSDLFSEVYGYKWSRITCYLGFAFNLFMVLIFSLVIITPAPEYWANQEAFQLVLGSAPRILFASMIAFLIGDFVNDKVFAKMKKRYPNNHNGFGFRAITSSLCGQIVDSLIFMPIAFLGLMPVPVLIQLIVLEIMVKTSYEVFILPLTTIIVKKVSKAEGITESR